MLSVKTLIAACALGSLGAFAIPSVIATAVGKLASCDVASSGKSWLSAKKFTPDAKPSGNQASDLAGPAIEALIRVSRWKARREGTRPMPAGVREALSDHFSAALLEKVRWVSLDRELRDIAFREECLGGTGALTLHDTVIFSSDQAAADLHLWAHELMHVVQYTRLGVDGFARKYARSPHQLERQAEAFAQRMVSDRSAAWLGQS